jgi:hypothetical protein
MRQWEKFQIRQQFQKGIMYDFEEKQQLKTYTSYTHIHIYMVILDVWGIKL